MVDKPGPRKVHLKPIPLLGGIAIYLGFVLRRSFSLVTASRSGKSCGILAGATLLALVGFLDDGGLLHHQVKLFIGMPVAALYFSSSPEFAPNCFRNSFRGIPGLDSRYRLSPSSGSSASPRPSASSITWTASAPASPPWPPHFFTISAIRERPDSWSRTLGAATLGAALGFLRWNFNPAKIFMGDGGAMFLGFLMATLGLKIRPDGALFPLTWLVPVLILGVPIFDTTLVSISRARRGLLPFTSPGKDHTAHRLSNLPTAASVSYTGTAATPAIESDAMDGTNAAPSKSWGHRRAVLTLYALSIILGILALFVPQFSPATVYTLAALLAVVAVAAILILETLPYERQPKLPKPNSAA